MTGHRILQISSYPPPRAGWGIRVQYLKQELERAGHECVVLNIGSSRRIPSPEYETVLHGLDYVRKVWRFSRRGFAAHVHVNGKTYKGLVLSIVAELLNRLAGQQSVLTFHAGVDQDYFPREKRPDLAPVFRLLFRLPRRIVCNNEAVKARIVDYGVPPSKVVPIPAFSRQYLAGASVELPADVAAFYTRYPQVVISYMRMRTLFYPVVALDGAARVLATRPEVGLVICGTAGHADPGVPEAVRRRVDRPDLRGRVLLVEDLSHDEFLEALRRAAVYLRTPPTDGVASSVLEASGLGVPVVASANETRPPGTTTYPAEDAEALATALASVLDARPVTRATRALDDIPDTLADEVRLLTS